MLLVESAPGHRIPSEYPPELVDAGVLPVGPDSRWVWPYQVNLTSERSGWIARGRVLGGSGAVNGGYFVRAQTDDFDRWPRSWSFDEVLPYYKRIESDADFTGPWHGSDGPIPVHREPRDRWHPVSSAFVDVARDAGHAEDPDKNAPGSHGVGPGAAQHPGRREGGSGVGLPPADLGRPTSRALRRQRYTKVRVRRHPRGRLEIATERGCTPSVRRRSSSPPARCRPALLMLSRVGDALHLRVQLESRHPVVADLPAVGPVFSDHPRWCCAVQLPGAGAQDHECACPAGDPATPTASKCARTQRRSVTSSRILDRPAVPVASVLMKPHRRGDIRLVSADPGAPPSVSYRYLESAADRDALRAALLPCPDLMRTRCDACPGRSDDVDTSTSGCRITSARRCTWSGSLPDGGRPATSVVDEECRGPRCRRTVLVDTVDLSQRSRAGAARHRRDGAERASTLLESARDGVRCGDVRVPSGSRPCRPVCA